MEVKVKNTHSGQYRRYGDFYRVWEILSDMSEEETLDYCFNNIYPHKIPEQKEYQEKSKYGGEKWGDYGYHFAGYYTLEKIDGGYKFTVCEPYAD